MIRTLLTAALAAALWGAGCASPASPPHDPAPGPSPTRSVLYLDLGTTAGTEGAPTDTDAEGRRWNNLAAAPQTLVPVGTRTDLVQADGTSSGLSVTVTKAAMVNGLTHGGLAAPSAALLGDLAAPTATEDFFYTSNAATPFQLTFEGLDPGRTYRFSVFGSRFTTETRVASYTFTGADTEAGTLQTSGTDLGGPGIHQNISRLFVTSPLAPDAAGRVVFDVAAVSGSYAHVNALKVEEFSGGYIPATGLEVTGAGPITTWHGTLALAATVTPADATVRRVVWSVDDPTLASVDASGLVTALADGTVRVTAALKDGSLRASASLVLSGQTYSLLDQRIVMLGSSVANGQGATGMAGYRVLYAQTLADRLASGLSPWAWDLRNASVNGNNTSDVLARWDRDLVPLRPRYVIFGLSLGNEGIHGAADPQAVFDQFQTHLRTLIDQARALGMVPVVMNNYGRADFTPVDYQWIRKMDLDLHQWDVPSANLLGAVDNGAGQWPAGYQSDVYHPNDAGHAEMARTLVPSLFDALAAGKPRPQRGADGPGTALGPGTLTVVPEGSLHPFAWAFDFQTQKAGKVASFQDPSGVGVLELRDDGALVYRGPGAAVPVVGPLAADGTWHRVVLTHYRARGLTFLSVDGNRVGSAAETLAPGSLTLGGPAEPRVRQLFLYRSAMNEDEGTALAQGKLLQSSLEVYAPLDATSAAPLENRAQSTNLVVEGPAP